MTTWAWSFLLFILLLLLTKTVSNNPQKTLISTILTLPTLTFHADDASNNIDPLDSDTDDGNMGIIFPPADDDSVDASEQGKNNTRPHHTPNPYHHVLSEQI